MLLRLPVVHAPPHMRLHLALRTWRAALPGEAGAGGVAAAQRGAALAGQVLHVRLGRRFLLQDRHVQMRIAEARWAIGRCETSDAATGRCKRADAAAPGDTLLAGAAATCAAARARPACGSWRCCWGCSRQRHAPCAAAAPLLPPPCASARPVPPAAAAAAATTWPAPLLQQRRPQGWQACLHTSAAQAAGPQPPCCRRTGCTCLVLLPLLGCPALQAPQHSRQCHRRRRPGACCLPGTPQARAARLRASFRRRART